MTEMLKRTFYEGYASMSIDFRDILMCLGTTVLIALYIFLIYRIINKRSFYNKNFNLSLITMSVITAAIILTIQSSVVVSLGMVGALSIVRFRTAIKDPMDLMFLFWAISVGIICGAGFALIAAIASAVITLVIVVIKLVPSVKPPLILLVNSHNFDDEEKIMEIVKKHCDIHTVKARNLTKEHIDLAIEVRSNSQTELVRELMEIEGVVSASLVAHDGEATY